MFKFALKQTIYYLRDNRVHSAPVLSRMCVENAHQDWACTDEQKYTFTRFGKNGIFYATCHGSVNEDEAFASKEELAQSLLR